MSQKEVDNLEFEQVHHISTWQTSNDWQIEPRPIIGAFSKIKEVYSNTLKISTDNLKLALMPILKKAKQDKKNASFNVDKLIMNGQVYCGPETKKLPLYAKIMSC